MTSMSKLFLEASAGKTCCDLWHPEIPSCSKALLDVMLTVLPGSYKLYLPLLIIPPLLKGKVTLKYLYEHTLDYSSISWRTYCEAVIGFGSICTLYKFFGKFHFFSVMAVPGLLSALLTPKFKPQHLKLQGITYFNMMLEVIIRKSGWSYMKHLRTSKWFGTLAFMIMSSMTLNALKQMETSQLWLIIPTKIKTESRILPEDQSTIMNKIINCEHQICSHDETCDKYFITGVVKYALVGLIIEVSRAFISKFNVLLKNPLLFKEALMKTIGYKLPLFSASYVGLYRITECLLNRYNKNENPNYAKVAGFMCGISYFLYPKYQVFTLCFTKCMELNWEYFMKYGNMKYFKILKFINKLPILSFLHMFSIGYLYHTSLFYPDLSPFFHNKAMSFCSGDRVKKMVKVYQSWLIK
ncbi:unnamed protein product [Diamesa tonsa]